MPKVYLDDNGEPVGAAPPKVYLDDNGDPVGATKSSEHEPDTYAGGFAKSALKTIGDTGKGIASGFASVFDPRTYIASDQAAMDEDKRVRDEFTKTGKFPKDKPEEVGAGGLRSLGASLSDPTTGGQAIGGLLALKAAPAMTKGALRMASAVGDIPLAPVAKGVGTAMRAIGDFDMTRPLKSTVGKLGGHLEAAAQNAMEAQGSPNVKTTSNWLPERPAPIEPQAPPVDISTPVKAGNMSQADIRARIDAVRANGGLSASTEAQMPTIRGQLRSTPSQAAAAPITEPVMPEAWKPLVGESSPMQQPRVDIGAEKVGRSAGLTKEQVRMQTEPIVGEAKGEASPILPEMPLQRIIDTLKALPKGGPEREAYVARATSGKARGQVENIRRTLEHLGLIVPIAAGTGAAIRSGVMDRLRGSEPTKDTQSRQ